LTLESTALQWMLVPQQALTRRAVAERGVKTQGCFAQALIGGAEQIVVGNAMAVGKTAGLLLGQVQVGDGELALFRA
jgi:hypothetical protein